MAARLREITSALDVPFIFKASYDKANRTSIRSFRGPGLERGLEILARIRRELGVAVTSDVHEVGHVGPAAEVLDLLQIPAFLCRQTDLIVAAAATGRPVNIKKGQFLAPGDLVHAVEKARSTGNRDLLVTERGTSGSRETARKVLETEAEAVAALIPRLDHGFDQAIELLVSCTGRVVLTGMGKSGIIARKIAATLSSTGTPALFVHPADAIHGDLGMLAERDLAVAVSNSGETHELVRLLPTLKRRVRPSRKVIFDGVLEARLVALACSPAPPGRTRWTLRLLAEKVVELGWVGRVSVMTVQRTLKKTNCSLIGRSTGGSHPGAAPHS